MKQDKTPAFLGSFEVPGLKKREMLTEYTEDHPLDARNSIHKEAILSRCSNAETRWYKPIVAWALYWVGTSAHDLMHKVDREKGRGRRSEPYIDSLLMPPVVLWK